VSRARPVPLLLGQRASVMAVSPASAPLGKRRAPGSKRRSWRTRRSSGRGVLVRRRLPRRPARRPLISSGRVRAQRRWCALRAVLAYARNPLTRPHHGGDSTPR
jgi:hypothetical protein